MRAYLYLLTVFLGVLLTVHLAMNARVGAAMANPRVGNALFWCIGAITATSQPPARLRSMAVVYPRGAGRAKRQIVSCR